MDIFKIYLQLGYQHILDFGGLDHILFLVVLSAVYKASEWKKVVLLATAFTLGHSLTLGLAAFDIIRFSPKVIELLIPLTILLTAIYNCLFHSAGIKNYFFSKINKKHRINYLFAAFFGLIHGMGFSNFFRSAAMPGEDGILIQQLLAFNIGVEIGQFLIIGMILLLAWFSFQKLKIKHIYWNWFFSGVAAIASVYMLIERI